MLNSAFEGRGRQVIAVAKTADLVLMMLDATKGEKQVCEIRNARLRLQNKNFVKNFIFLARTANS